MCLLEANKQHTPEGWHTAFRVPTTTIGLQTVLPTGDGGVLPFRALILVQVSSLGFGLSLLSRGGNMDQG